MISYYQAATQNITAEIIEINHSALGIYSKVSDPDQVLLYIPGGVKPLGLFTGNTLQPNGFTWRWLPLWLNRGITLALVDMPEKFYQTDMSPEYRRNEDRISTICKMIEYLRERYPNAKISGYGHSYGSLEMSVLSKMQVLDSIVIGSGNWNPDPNQSAEHANIFVDELSIDSVKTPLLIVHHVLDNTSKCQYSAAKKFMDKFNSITVQGGMPHLGNPGLEPGPHFFHLQENEVIKNIVSWLRNKKYCKFIL